MTATRDLLFAAMAKLRHANIAVTDLHQNPPLSPRETAVSSPFRYPESKLHIERCEIEPVLQTEQELETAVPNCKSAEVVRASREMSVGSDGLDPVSVVPNGGYGRLAADSSASTASGKRRRKPDSTFFKKIFFRFLKLGFIDKPVGHNSISVLPAAGGIGLR
ncbi:unnamed protein product [Gongylonema pulchrum]|uniref:Uncharacterized protein n=1 Tax=Gongylonema pulchrum TaxID=637853 RepID=A0A183DTZ5_9BILA|nr:unnamed protein product [Gongylonema pulchrum]